MSEENETVSGTTETTPPTDQPTGSQTPVEQADATVLEQQQKTPDQQVTPPEQETTPPEGDTSKFETVTPVPPVTPPAAPAEPVVPAVIEQVGDTSTQKTSTVDPVVTTDPNVTPVHDDVPVAVEDNDSESVKTLKLLLNAFKEELLATHNSPNLYENAAKLSANITRFVINNHQNDVLDTFLQFFVDNITDTDGVCQPHQYMKGSILLTKTEEQRVGFVYNLFFDLATKSNVKVDNSKVVNVLGRPELFNYVQRKRRAFQ